MRDVIRQMILGICMCLLGGLMSLSWANGHEASKALEALKAFAQLDSAKGAFTQQQTAQQKKIITSSGTFAFLRPGRFIWTYQKPYEQVLQADGRYLYVYDRDLEQVTRHKLDQAIYSSAAAILLGSRDLSQGFHLKNLSPRQGMDWLELVPKMPDSPFQRICMGFRRDDLAEMLLYDAFGHQTRLTFHHIEENPPLSPSFFQFVMPRKADLIDG
jgi:outer membrane lipoprotein carrier protein